MDIDDIAGWLLPLVERYGGYTAATAAALVTAVLALRLVRWCVRAFGGFARGSDLAELLYVPVLLIALAVTVDGMYRVATGPMDLRGVEVWAPTVVYESLTLYLGHLAQRRKNNPDKGNTGSFGTAVWTLSIIAGFIAGSAGDNVTTMAARFAIPVVAVWTWWVKIHDGDSAAPTQASTRRWTWRRLLLAIGAVEPAATDIADEVGEWQVRRLARAIRMANGGRLVRRIGRWILVRRAESTSPVVLAQARVRAVDAYLMSRDADWGSAVMKSLVSVRSSGHSVAGSAAVLWPNPGQPMAGSVAETWPNGGQSSGLEVATGAAVFVADGRPDPGQSVAVQVASPRPEDGRSVAAEVDPETAHKELVRQLARGKRLTRSMVVDMYGVGDGTAGRWLRDARKAVTRKTSPRTRLATSG